MDKAQGKKIYYGIVLDNEQLRRDAEQSKRIFQGIGDASKNEASRIDNAFRKIAGAAAAVFTVQQAANFANSIVRVRGEVEALSISFETLLGGNKQKAQALFSEIRTFAVNTPMMLNDLARGAQMLLSFNIEPERVMPTLKQIGDISMGDAQKFNSLTLAYSQMMSTGKLMGQDLLQMINAGFNPLSVISEKTGKSIGQLKKEMEAGAISSEMVADAFAAATAEGGKFYGMLEKQSKGINGSISNLKGAIDDMLNDIGTANQDIITGSISAATSVVRHYEEIGETIAVLVAIYGTYRTALIATEAVRKSVETVKHTEEAAELYKLLTVEQKAKISKMSLSKTSAEYAKVVKAEVVAEMERQTKLAVATKEEIAAARVRLGLAEKEKAAIAQKVAAREAELAAAVASGNAKKIEAAQTNLNTAQEQLNTASVNVNTAAREVNSKRAQLDSAVRRANTLENKLNTIELNKNATATGFLTVAKERLRAATAKLNAVIKKNPYALAAAAVAALIYGLIKLITYQTDADKAQSKLNEAIKKASEDFNTEAARIQALQDILNKGNLAYKERKKALDELQQIVPDYNAQLTAEGTLINNNTEAIKNYLVQFERQIKMKAVQEELEEAYRQKRQLEKEYNEKYNAWSAMNTNSAYHDKPIIDVLGAFGGRDIQKAEREKDEAAAKLRENIAVIAELNREIETTGTSIGGGASPDNKPISSIKTEVKETAALITELKQQLADLRSGKTVPESGSVAEAIEAKSKELKEAESKYKLLTGKDASDTAKTLDEYEKIVLAAQERLAREEIELERNKIEDKAELIESDRQQTVAAIEKTRREALTAWTDAGLDADSFDDSVFQDLIEAANLRAEFDTEKVKKEQAEKEREELNGLLKEFQTYQQKRVAIEEEYGEKITALRAAGEEEAAEEAERQRDKALASLSQSMMEESDLWVRLFDEASTKTVSQIEDIIEETQALLDYLQGKEGAAVPVGFSEEELKSLKGSPEIIEKIQQAIKQLKGEVGTKSPFKKFENDIKAAIGQIKNGVKDKDKNTLAAGIMNVGAAVDAVSPAVKKLGEDLGTIFGDSQIEDDIGILTDTLTGIGTAAAGVGQIMSRDVLGGITSVVSGIASLVSMADEAAEKHREALKSVMNSQIDQQREYNLLLLQQKLLYEEGATIFGNNEYGKAKRAVEVYKEARAELNEAMFGNEAQRKSQWGHNQILEIFGIKDSQATLKQIYAGLADISIKTGHEKTGLFGWGKGKDVYSSILEVYPQLIKQNKEFDKELAETILATREMSEEDKKALQNVVELYEEYEEAMKGMRDYLGSIFGELGNTMSDALVDAFKNGTDAGETFYKSVSGMLENLAQQMIYSVTLAPVMEKAQKQMLEIMEKYAGDDSMEAKEAQFKEFSSVLSDLMDDAMQQHENANYLMQLYQDMAAEKGIDIFQPDAERQASSKGIATASQDSVEELNGRFTAIQGLAFDIREAVNVNKANVADIRAAVNAIAASKTQDLIDIRQAVNSIAASKTQDLSKIEVNTDCLHTIDTNVYGIRESAHILVANSARMLEHLAGIEDNTSRLHEMSDDISEVRSGLTSLRRSVDNIAVTGIKLKK